MQIIVSYSKSQLNSTIDFICKNNPYFLGKNLYVENHILKCMEQLVKDPDATYLATMGFILVCDMQSEDMENDENICHIEMYVNPNIGSNSGLEEFIINT